MKASFINTILLFAICNVGIAQFDQANTTDIDTKVSYEENIKKEYINDIYIPIDMEDAYKEISRLSDDESLIRFRDAEEEVVARKLHFGLGKWIMLKWNMHEGSRFSHYLRNMGVSFPDDMAKFVIVSYHRYLNGREIQLEERAKAIKDKREKEHRDRIAKQKLLKEYKKKIPKG